MNIKERIYRFKHYSVVQHAKYNPEGQGIVRMHLLPSKRALKQKSDIIILNGKIIIPIAPAWSILLSCFMRELNEENGEVISNEKKEEIISKSVARASKIYFSVPKSTLKEDLCTIIDVLEALAKGKKKYKDIGQSTIAEYSKYMNGPHKVYFMLNNVDSKANKHSNNRCLHYSEPLSEKYKIKELGTEEWEHIIRKCRKACIPHIVFTGGKPTEREDLLHLIEESKWFVTTLNCTGKNLNKDFCESLHEAGLNNVSISIYSHDKDVHNKLANEDNYDKVVEGIKNAVSSGIFVNLHISICKLNSDVLETVKFANKLGVNNFSISVMDCNSDNRENFSENELTKNDVYEILKEVSDYACTKTNKIQINFETPNFIDKEKLEKIHIDPPICSACLYEIAIMQDGTVMPCINVSDERYALGNMLIDSWKDIWQSTKCKRMRKISIESISECPIKRYTKG